MRKVKWKIYFIVILIAATPSYLKHGFERGWEIIDILIFYLALLGLFCFAWGKSILPKIFWKIFFFTQIIWNIFYLYFVPLPDGVKELTQISQFNLATINLIFYIPLFLALYFYAFTKKVTEKTVT